MTVGWLSPVTTELPATIQFKSICCGNNPFKGVTIVIATSAHVIILFLIFKLVQFIISFLERCARVKVGKRHFEHTFLYKTLVINENMRENGWKHVIDLVIMSWSLKHWLGIYDLIQCFETNWLTQVAVFVNVLNGLEKLEGLL